VQRVKRFSLKHRLFTFKIVYKSQYRSHPEKKIDLRGASRPPSILIRPSNAGREIPRTPALSDLGSGAIS